MSVLGEICARKREHVRLRKEQVDFADIRVRAGNAPAPRSFIGALKKAAAPAIIAEVKKASPSKGVIRADFDPVAIARTYESNSAACLSVLTDEPYFQGKDEYLQKIRAAVSLPLLRKDFMLDEYQIYESRALGADCILLIMAALTDYEARDLYRLAGDIGMDVLVEVHDETELQRALKFNPQMVGVNNRDLKSLKVDIEVSKRLAPMMPTDMVKIAESGIPGPVIIKELGSCGYNAFLVGESLIREADIGAALRRLRSAT